MADAKQVPVNIALVAPDGLSVVLFCKGIIRSLKNIPGARVIVICDAGKYEQEISLLGVECVTLPMYRWFSPWEDIKYTYHLWRVMRRYGCDTIFNFCTKQNIYGTFAGKLSGAMTNYLHVVGLGSGFEKREDFRGKIMRLGFVCLYRIACHWTDKTWFTNGNDRQFFIENGFISGESTVLTRNYMDTSDYALDLVGEERKKRAMALCGLEHSEKVVVMVARMIWQKGIREFSEAAELLRDSYPMLKFILIAPLEEGSADAVPESYVQAKEQSANFQWLGFQTDVKSFYAIADLAVLPTYYKEGGYPRGLLEPMAMGRPVIGTTSEDCRGAVEDGKNGFLIPIQDSSALAEAIARIMADDELRETMGRYSLEKARRDFDEVAIVPDALRKLGLPIVGA
jgi:N,N'-diacetylbacillosaminyl-diphospho-undecaprenol alpha-1,3-N-acetylgalactosaminyltransferase